MRVVGLGYVSLAASDLEAWREFATTVLGAGVGPDGADGSLRLRVDERRFRISIHQGIDSLDAIGWDVADVRALEEAESELRSAGLEPERLAPEECKLRAADEVTRVRDPFGFLHELGVGAMVETDPPELARPMAGFVGLGHVVLRVPSLEDAKDFYTTVFGMSLSDEVEDTRSGRSLRAVFFRCSPAHHSLAVLEGSPGLEHLFLEVRDLDDLGRTLDLCVERGCALTGLGRHSNNRAVSFYLRSPSGFEIEYGWASDLVDDDVWSVRRFDRPAIWGFHRCSADTET